MSGWGPLGDRRSIPHDGGGAGGRPSPEASDHGMRVLIVDNVSLYREALASILDGEPSIDAVETADDVDEALRRLDDALPTVVLLNMATARSADVLGALVGAAPRTPVVALAVSETEDEVVACAEAGAAGYLIRQDSLAALVAVIHSVAKGETLCSPRVTATLLRRVAALASERKVQAMPARLTARERQILQLVDAGLSNKQIAHRLSIDIRTVKNHVHHILEKLQVHSRGEAAARFRAAGSLPVALPEACRASE
jgi:two-component system, NarL family, nitrate/nitrite response regulator NarL